MLVTIDTLRADRVGCYGADHAHTPTLDATAASGVRFETAVSPAPLTLPAHASLMTGLDPPRHGVRHNSIYALQPGIPTLAGRMSDAGFETAAFVGAAVLARRFGLDSGFAHYDDDFVGGDPSGTVGFAERSAGSVVDAALRWLADAPPRFFLWVHLYDPHADYQPPSGFASGYPGDPYAGEIAYADAQIGRLLDGIRERWGSRGLLIAITSDHGESLGEHGEPTHSYSLYEATQRIPLILSGPGLPVASAVYDAVGLVDLAPTLLALSRATGLAGADGRDLAGLISGAQEHSRPVYMETLATQLDHGWSPLLAIRAGRYKFIRAPRPELYDLVRDPNENQNRASAESGVVAELNRQLEAKLAGAIPSEPLAVPESERRRLESLGYTVPAPGVANAGLGVVGGVDPKDEVGVLEALSRAHTALSEGRPADALEGLGALGDRGTVVAGMRAVAALSLGDFGQAGRDARSVLREQPNRPDIEVILGRALEGERDYAGALAAFGRAAALDPTAASAQLGSARSREALGDREGALQALERARQLDPSDVEVLWRLAALLLEEREPERADAVLSQLPADLLHHTSIAIRLARAELAAGRPERAKQRLETALEQHPAEPRLVAEIARVAVQQSR